MENQLYFPFTQICQQILLISMSFIISFKNIVQCYLITLQKIIYKKKYIKKNERLGMSFFQQQTSQEDLIYDNIAFFHFLVSILIIASIVTFLLIWRDINKWRKPPIFSKLQKMDIFKQKVKKTLQLNKKKFITKNLVTKIIILLFLITASYYCINVYLIDSKLISFDPYQILGVNINANNTQIKKAYRKLALSLHPDKNKNDQAAYNKFMLISKAYKCLTDQSTKQSCIKFGNPDGGELTYKIGIGLPSFILSPKYAKYISYVLLALILCVLPIVFFLWISQKNIYKRKSVQNFPFNLKIAHTLITPELNQMDCCIIYGCMKQLQQIENSVLDVATETDFRIFLMHASNLNQKLINRLSSKQIQRIFCVYNYLSNNAKNQWVALKVSNFCKKILNFSLLCSKKSLEGSYYCEESKLKVKYYGFRPCKQVIKFSRQMFHKSFQPNIYTMLNYNQQSEQDVSQKQTHKQINLNQLLSKQIQFNEFTKNLKQQTKQKTTNTLLLLPLLKLQAKTMIDQKQINQITTRDIITVRIIIFKIRQTPNYVICQNFPLLQQEQFVLLVSSNINLLGKFYFSFRQKQNCIKHSFQLKRLQVGQHILNIKVLSLCYASEVSQTVKIKVNKIKKKQINFHEQDLKLQSIPKSFYQTLISLNVATSDLQFSDSQQNQNQKQKNLKNQKYNKKNKNKTQQIQQKQHKQNVEQC